MLDLCPALLTVTFRSFSCFMYRWRRGVHESIHIIATKGASIMDAIFGFFATAWEGIANFFLNTLGLQGIWDTISGLFG